MDSISDAVVYAVAYLHCREAREGILDDDESALEHVMAYLSHATTDEENALAAAAERALLEEQSLERPSRAMIEFLSKWMEAMLGRDWDGNRRL
ncbi:hypothetical protein [Botrimarina hoheduenensis]|uniref:Uncharacterized protein n=1 Tax=Botrimarina hoheduenensis TaxID=2528000 RepID=A0A5C5VQK8_9BACT|nr:hypothetical protein [Botrimarina hoheduenensis]TWT40091.1 hypothetical protein Pla111_34640 [Botrimarina hoheduenensis]